MLKFSKYVDTSYESLDEGIQQWLSKAKNMISRSFNTAMKKVKKLKAGQSISVPVRMPKNISEAKEKQLGKKGGELAEVAMMRKLFKMLQAQRVEVYYWQDGKKLSQAGFNKGVFDKNLQDYRKQEGKNARKRENDWIKHGEAGALHVFTHLNELEGPWDLYRIKLEHLGEALTGISKGDINVIVEVKKSSEVLDYIGHLSVKTTLDGSPFDTPENGLQTGWTTFIFQMLTGKTSNVLKKDWVTETKIESLIKAANKTLETQSAYLDTWVDKASDATTPGQRKNVAKRIKQYRAGIRDAKSRVDEAQQLYKNTVEYALDELGEKIGYETSLSKYMKEVDEVFKEYLVAPGRANATDESKRKPADIVMRNTDTQKEYMSIIKRALDMTLKSPKKKEQLIQGILKLGGIESGLDYLALGVNPDDKEASWAVSTLGNKDYAKLEKVIMSNLDAHVDFISGGKGLVFTITKNKKEIMSFDIHKHVNNVRINLPHFDGGPDQKSLSLISKFGRGYE